MFNSNNNQKICLERPLRKLWEQHVYWTRFFIISTAADLKDLQPVTNRLLRNPMDFEQLLQPVYGSAIAGQFKELLTMHLLIGGDLVTAAKNGQAEKVEEARTKWYKNAEEIAAFFAAVNPCWNKAKWECMLFDHLKMTENEAVLRLQGNYEDDIIVFDQIESEALEMADYMACGIMKQCYCR